MPNAKMFFPVIHCINHFFGGIQHANDNLEIAIENGADGVFLIGHGITADNLFKIGQNISTSHPDVFLGVNFLGLDDENTSLSNYLSSGVFKALWMDIMPRGRELVPANTVLYGGVAFKYIDPDLCGDALKEACRRAIGLVDVVTTSGPRTGMPPDMAKLAAIREHIGNDKLLALASGVDESNAALFLEHVDHFLVASSITKNHGGYEFLVPSKVRRLSEIIHN